MTTSHARRRPTRLALSATVVLVTVATVTGCTAPARPHRHPSATSSAVAERPTMSPTRPVPDRVGQATGSFAPLRVPDGIPLDGDLAPGMFTPAGTHLEVGQVAVIDGTPCGSTGQVALLVSVDEITRPLTGPDRAQALTAVGYDPGTSQIVQKITLRARQVAGPDVGTRWGLSTAVRVENYGFHEPMPQVAPSGDTPLVGHGTGSGDTVQAVLYAAGTPDQLVTDPLEAVQLITGCDRPGRTVPVDSPYLSELAGGTGNE